MKYYSVILTIHVICGFTALFGGLFPMFAKKGSRLHVRMGWVYFWAMFGVFATTVAMFLLKQTEVLLFLLLIGILSFYLTFTGVRAAKFKKKGSTARPLDWIVSLFVLVCGFSMIGLAGYHWYQGNDLSLGILFAFFGIVTASQAKESLTEFRIRQSGTTAPKHWMYMHAVKMGGAYIATTTAFLVVNNSVLPNLVVWIAPGIIGGFIIKRVCDRLFTADKRGVLRVKR